MHIKIAQTIVPLIFKMWNLHCLNQLLTLFTLIRDGSEPPLQNAKNFSRSLPVGLVGFVYTVITPGPKIWFSGGQRECLHYDFKGLSQNLLWLAGWGSGWGCMEEPTGRSASGSGDWLVKRCSQRECEKNWSIGGMLSAWFEIEQEWEWHHPLWWIHLLAAP